MRKHRNNVDPDLQTNKQTPLHRRSPAVGSLRVCVCVCSFLARFPLGLACLFVRLPPPLSVCCCCVGAREHDAARRREHHGDRVDDRFAALCEHRSTASTRESAQAGVGISGNRHLKNGNRP